MALKSRLLTSALVLPWLVIAPAVALDLTGIEDDADYTDTVKTSVDGDGEDIEINGPPSDTSKAGLLIDAAEAVTVNGAITIRDRDPDDVDTLLSLGEVIGIKVDTALGSGQALRLEENGDILIDEVRGPDYDGSDEDSLPDANDADGDGILEGSQALAGTNRRIGLWVNAMIVEALIGESGSAISIEGNGDSSNIVAGVLIGQALSNQLDLSTSISMFGDNARGVDIDAAIGGFYRQRGSIDVRGAGGVGIDIDGTIAGSLLIEGLVNATGYSTAPNPTRGGLDTEDDNEFDDAQQAANPSERRRGGSAIDVGAAIAGGIIVNGTANRVMTRAENRAFSCLAEDSDCSADGINAQRSADLDVTALKTSPYHYDENRSSGLVTTFGEAAGEAALKISATIGTADGATVEHFLDTFDDDSDDTVADTDDVADLYDSTQKFYYSHGLMNRGSITSSTWYDAVKSGSYQVPGVSDDPLNATAVLLNGPGAILHGGIYNSGTISATAYNGHATALDIADITLTDGLRDNDIIFLNEGTISAVVATLTKSYDTITKSDRSATAVKLAGGIGFAINGAVPTIDNRGTVTAASTHTQLDAATVESDDYETITGDNAIAFDLSAYGSAFNLIQQMQAADTTFLADVDSTMAGDETVYSGGGDTDIDRSGDIGQSEDGTDISIGDGKIDTRDVIAPRIVGDVLFGNGNNDLTITAGSLSGNISFGDGTDTLVLGNSMEDDVNNADNAEDDYTAPVTTLRGAIKKGGGVLSIRVGGETPIVGEKTRLHFDGQEATGFAGVAISTMDLQENAELRFSINPQELAADTALLNVATLTLGDDVEISLDISGLIERGTVQEFLLIDAANDLSAYSRDINTRQPTDEAHPFIYDVTLSVDDTDNHLLARFEVKDDDALGLNKTELNSFQAALAHFRGNDQLERAITAITEQDDFLNAYQQLLPHYGDGSMKQLSHIAEAANGAVSQHLQIVSAGGRRGGDGWFQQFGDYRKQDATRQTATLSGTSYGLAFGYDAPTAFIDALGIYGQVTFTSVNEKTANTNEVATENYALGAYLADRIGPLRYEFNAAAGTVNFESMRFVNFNGVADSLTAGWDGTSTAASARLAWPIFENHTMLRLEGGIDYFALEQDGYDERTRQSADPGLSLRIGDAESELTSNFIGLRGGIRRGGGSPAEIVWEPSYYFGARSYSDYTPYQAQANFIGSSETFTLKSQDELEDVGEIGFGVAAHNDYFALEFNYRGQFGDGVETHGGGLSIRLLF